MRYGTGDAPRRRLDSDPLSGERVATRRELSAALALLECGRERRMDRASLCAWLQLYVVGDTRGDAPDTVHELDVGAASLGAGADEERVAEVVEAACARVLNALWGLLDTPRRDGFAVAALMRGLVERRSSEGSFAVALRGTEPLSDMVLALVAADFLCHREEYENRLRVCAECGRVDFEGNADDDRRACDAHR